jgi:hypothetical protein
MIEVLLFIIALELCVIGWNFVSYATELIYYIRAIRFDLYDKRNNN